MTNLPRTLLAQSFVVMVTLLMLSTIASAQTFTPGWDAHAKICRFESDFSYYQRFEAAPPEEWGSIVIEWQNETGAVTEWSWTDANGDVFSELWLSVYSSPIPSVDARMQRNITVSSGWRFHAYVTPYYGNTIDAILHPMGYVYDPEWVFGGVWMQTGSRPLTAHGLVSCSVDEPATNRWDHWGPQLRDTH